jgi:CCR4-NOT complex subunit CAF16
MSTRRPASALEVNGLDFCYPGSSEIVLRRVTFSLPRGARCLVLGANGTGKSTLLRVLAGRHMVAGDLVRVLGRSAFHDTKLAGEVAFLGGDFPFHHDIAVGELLESRMGVDRERRARLMDVLDVDPAWRMHRVSDGQRRRVQILLDLERRLSVILLDEVTADLDVLARADLLRLLREDSEQSGLTVMYASHVLDGLARWATHMLFLSPGRVRAFGPIAQVLPEGHDLHALCETWMAEDRRLLRGGRAGRRDCFRSAESIEVRPVVHPNFSDEESQT